MYLVIYIYIYYIIEMSAKEIAKVCNMTFLHGIHMNEAYIIYNNILSIILKLVYIIYIYVRYEGCFKWLFQWSTNPTIMRCVLFFNVCHTFLQSITNQCSMI